MQEVKPIISGTVNKTTQTAKKQEKKTENQQKSSSQVKTAAVVLSGLAAAGAITAAIIAIKKGKISAPDINKKTIEELKDNAAEELKQQQIKTTVDEIRQKLSGKTKINAQTIDESFNNYKSPVDGDYDYNRLKRHFSDLEKEEQKIKGNVSQLKEKMHAKQEISAEKIDKQFERQNSKLDELNSYFKTLEEESEAEAKRLAEKQAKKEQWQKFAAEHPEEAAKIKAEKNAAKRAAQKAKKAQMLEANTKFITNIDGEKIKVVTTTNKDGSKTIRQFSADGKNLIREIQESEQKTVETVVNGDIKTSIITDAYGNMTTKMSVKNKDGNFELIRRETINRGQQTSKLVEQLENGNSKTTITNDYEKVVTIRDKKGNILSEERFNKYNPEPPKPAEVKVLADWYVNYLKLCKKYGVEPRICGVKGGAWDHFYELNLRDTNPEAYESYLRLRSYRAKYDETARIMQALDNGKLDPASLEYAEQTQSFESMVNQLNRLEEQQNNYYQQQQMVYM